MFRSISFWVIAFLITLLSAHYQRKTGPSYPLDGFYSINGSKYQYSLPRTHHGEDGQKIQITAPENSECTLNWKLYPSSQNITKTQMALLSGGSFESTLPHQPPAGKIQYFIEIRSGSETVNIPDGEAAIIRYRGDVPGFILVPHIITIFLAMLFSNRAGMESVLKDRRLIGLTHLTFTLLVVGGLILGPIVQYYAFGAFWTGFPFGHDLTDNKVAIAFIFWLIPFYKAIRKDDPRNWVLIASLVMLIIFMIPHSMFGSELKHQ